MRWSARFSKPRSIDHSTRSSRQPNHRGILLSRNYTKRASPSMASNCFCINQCNSVCIGAWIILAILYFGIDSQRLFSLFSTFLGNFDNHAFWPKLGRHFPHLLHAAITIFSSSVVTGTTAGTTETWRTWRPAT